MSLYDELERLSGSDIYPFHMPGHKRQIKTELNPYSLDITEIDNFDNLHSPEGVIKDIEDKWAEAYKAKRAHIMVNGSTGGILAGIHALTKKGDHVLMARNSHKAVYHGAMLRDLKVTYLMPELLPEGINGSISPADVERALTENPDISLVIITSPSYDGVWSDLNKIKEICLGHKAFLLVDCAHGAHYGLSSLYSENLAVKYGDITIMSLHKTLVSPTQTAIMTVNTDRVSDDRVRAALAIYETSSPSYLFMAAMEKALDYVGLQAKNLWEDYRKKLDLFYSETSHLEKLSVMDAGKRDGLFMKDPSKIIIFTNGYLSGQELMDRLRSEYHIECEMAAVNYVTALSSFMDTEEGFRRLRDGLFAIDLALSSKEEHSLKHDYIYKAPEVAVTLSDAMDSPMEPVPMDRAAGKISGEFFFLYPPGIPILAPGEVVANDFAEKIRLLREKNYQVNGQSDHTLATIKVLKKPF